MCLGEPEAWRNPSGNIHSVYEAAGAVGSSMFYQRKSSECRADGNPAPKRHVGAVVGKGQYRAVW